LTEALRGEPVFTLNTAQRRVVSFPRDGAERLFVRGIPGTGKTTALIARLAALLREGRRPYEILVLVPQRAQVERYERAIAQLRDAPTRGGADVITFYGLCRRSVALFWPLVAREAGFAWPDREPTFTTIETAQYFMWRIVEPLIAREGYFSDVTIRRERLLSQLIDNLNKAALVGFDHTDILARLKGAWTGAQEHVERFLQAQDCAIRFREYCLAHNLIDFSLATELYARHLLQHPVYQRFFRMRYRHLLVDNLEENVPVAHEMIAWAMSQCRSTVLVCDEGGGHRVFLGADAQGAEELAAECSEQIVFNEPLDASRDAIAFGQALCRALKVAGGASAAGGNIRRAILGQSGGATKYWVHMAQWTVERIAELVAQGVAPGEIAIVAPYVSEVARFGLEDALARRDIPVYLLRPSTPMREVPVVRGLLVLTLLAHPEWSVSVRQEPYVLPLEDIALALETALADLDPVRARRLAQAAVPLGARSLADLDPHADGEAAQELGRLWNAVGHQIRERYQTLRVWFETYREGPAQPVDVLLSSLFGDLLSRPGYGFYRNPDGARAYGRLVESAQKFREAVGRDVAIPQEDIAREYVQLILGGIASAEYLLDWPAERPADAVILAPAYTYLTRDIRSCFQFWIDVGADGWWHRPYQPLTQPYVLSKRWPPGRPWRDIEEDSARREALGRVVTGLTARCREGIYLAYSELGIDGSEQRGRLQRAVVSALLQGGA